MDGKEDKELFIDSSLDGTRDYALRNLISNAEWRYWSSQDQTEKANKLKNIIDMYLVSN